MTKDSDNVPDPLTQEPTKKCNSCQTLKSLSCFSKQNSSRDGYKYRCKDCDKRYFDKYYEDKKPQILEAVKSWQDKNYEKVSCHKRKYRDKILLKNKSVI